MESEERDMERGEYFSFFTELPHFVLIITIGFLAVYLLLPILYFCLYVPNFEIELLLIFSYFWEVVFVGWSNINPIILLFILLAFSYFAGFAFIGIYDAVGNKFVRYSAKVLDRLLKLSDNYKKRKNYYEKIENGITGNNVEKYEIGTKLYAKMQFELYKQENSHLRVYYNWEFLKSASCSYLAFLLITFWIFLIFFISYYIIDSSDKTININISFTSLLLIIIFTIVAYLSLEYGYLFYGAARTTARLEIYKKLEG